ncbi:MAG: Rieske 2Fe-2S domain-containing protein [Bacteroidales bacterium]|nr:Rieske 2Fe-2S domain-containing protein [Bacteroidales bacterium]
MYKQQLFSNLRFFIIIFIFCLLFKSCKDKNDKIPYVYVDIYLNIEDFTDLTVPGGSVNITGGVNGIVVYRISYDNFVAFDRTCSYQPEKNCKVSTDSSQNYLICSCCDSEFSIFTGSVTKSPAEFPLKEYQTELDGSSLHIFN